jgi:hypothetical protein
MPTFTLTNFSDTEVQLTIDGAGILFKKVYCFTQVSGDNVFFFSQQVETNAFRQQYTIPYTDCTDPSAVSAVELKEKMDFIINSYAEYTDLVLLEVKNTSGGSLAKGTPVYITGTVGATDVLTVSAADASNAAKMPSTGLLYSTLGNNEFGHVIVTGLLTQLTTDPIDGVTPTANQTVYVKAGGGLTLTKPTGTNLIQNVGKVGKVSGGGAGSLSVANLQRTNDIPNIPQNNLWIGNASGVPTAVTLSGDVTNSAGAVTIANDAVTYAKMQNVSAASKLLGRGDSGSGDVQEITLGTGLTMSGTTLNASGGGVTTIGTIDSATKSANGAVISGSNLVMQTADATNPGLVSTGTQTISGNKTITGESATVGNALVVNNLTPTAKLTVANAGRVTITQDTTVTTEVCSVITTDTVNANLVIAPNGTGALLADIPDGTTAGGNARGNNAVDLQTERSFNAQVASGNYSVIIGGKEHTASGVYSTIIGGNSNSSTQTSASIFTGGNICSATAINSSIVGADRSTASGQYSIVLGGWEAISYLYGQRTTAAGKFSANSDAQSSALTFRRSITGTAITELFLDGASVRAILALPTGAVNARAWRAQIDLVAICATAGGTTVLNEVFAGSYHCAIKRVGTVTSLVGAVSVTNEVSDTSMSTSVVTIDANDTNEALRIQFTPPTTAAAGTVIRVVATAYLTEVGR